MEDGKREQEERRAASQGRLRQVRGRLAFSALTPHEDKKPKAIRKPQKRGVFLGGGWDRGGPPAPAADALHEESAGPLIENG